jgi:hypothetical protein
MKVTARADRLIIDLPSMGLVIAALDSAAEAWLESASKPDQQPNVRKSLLKMAGEAKAMSILINAKSLEPDAEADKPAQVAA